MKPRHMEHNCFPLRSCCLHLEQQLNIDLVQDYERIYSAWKENNIFVLVIHVFKCNLTSSNTPFHKPHKKRFFMRIRGGKKGERFKKTWKINKKKLVSVAKPGLGAAMNIVQTFGVRF